VGKGTTAHAPGAAGGLLVFFFSLVSVAVGASAASARARSGVAKAKAVQRSLALPMEARIANNKQ
jgi:hypothetical protein